MILCKNYLVDIDDVINNFFVLELFDLFWNNIIVLLVRFFKLLFKFRMLKLGYNVIFFIDTDIFIDLIFF